MVVFLSEGLLQVARCLTSGADNYDLRILRHRSVSKDEAGSERFCGLNHKRRKLIFSDGIHRNQIVQAAKIQASRPDNHKLSSLLNQTLALKVDFLV